MNQHISHSDHSSPPKRVALFITCLVDVFRPQVGEATVMLLERQGIKVEFPQDQTCCGAPGYHAGWPEPAADLARRWIELFEPYEAVVSPSAACVAMVRQEYPRLLAADAVWKRRAQALAARTYELSQFLVDVLGAVDLGARFEGTITYQPACHLLRLLGVDRQPQALLSHVQGATMVALHEAETCCGFGGTFSIHMSQISGAMTERKIRTVEATAAELVVTCETGCLLQMAGMISRRKAQVRAVHLAELLAAMI